MLLLVVILATAAPAATQDAPNGSSTVEPPSGSAQVVTNTGYGLGPHQVGCDLSAATGREPEVPRLDRGDGRPPRRRHKRELGLARL